MNTNTNIPRTRPSYLPIRNPAAPASNPSASSPDVFGKATIRTGTATPRTEAPPNTPRLTGVASCSKTRELYNLCSEKIQKIEKQLSELNGNPAKILFKNELDNYKEAFNYEDQGELEKITVHRYETPEQKNRNQRLGHILGNLKQLQQDIGNAHPKILRSNSNNSIQVAESATPTTSMESLFQCQSTIALCEHSLREIKDMLDQYPTDSGLDSDEDLNMYQTINADLQNVSNETKFSAISNSRPETEKQVASRRELERLQNLISFLGEAVREKFENMRMPAVNNGILNTTRL